MTPVDCHDPVLNIYVTHSGPASVVALSGELDLATAGRLVALVEAVLDPSPATVLVDLGGTFVDVVGLHALIDVARSLAARGSRLTLAPVPPLTQRLIDVVDLRGDLSGADVPQRQRATAGA